MVVPDRSNQGERLRETLVEKLNALYAGKTFDIVGEVHLPKGQVFRTKYDSTGQHGFILQDRETGERQVVGHYMLRRIHRMYLCVNMPSRRRKVVRANSPQK